MENKVEITHPNGDKGILYGRKKMKKILEIKKWVNI